MPPTKDHFIQLGNQVADLEKTAPKMYLDFLASIMQNTNVGVYIKDNGRAALHHEINGKQSTTELRCVHGHQTVLNMKETSKTITDLATELRFRAEIRRDDDEQFKQVCQNIDEQATELSRRIVQ